MALSSPLPNSTDTFIATLLVLITTLLQVSGQGPTFTSAPAVAECGTRLLSLAPCAPFVQGSAPAPTQQCCDTLKVVYSQQPSCLCLFLNGIALRSLPFNASLALDLPGLCSPQMSPSFCSGTQPAPTAPAAGPVVSGTNYSVSSPIAVPQPGTPMVTATPIPSALLGFGRSAGHQRNGRGCLTFMLAATTLLSLNKELKLPK